MVLVLPILLLLLGGLVEVGVFINQYLNALDLTREAARFASVRDPYTPPLAVDFNCSTPNAFDFYYDTACVFSPPSASLDCVDSNFCNGLNPFLPFKPDQDDVVITVVTIDNHFVVKRWPGTNGWVLSDTDNGTPRDPLNQWQDNWGKDCKGGVVQTAPTFPDTRINGDMVAASPGSKAFVIVEYYYCYYQILHLPAFYQLIPNPIKIHTYTIMPVQTAPQCMDTLDNDGDLFRDDISVPVPGFSADPDCDSPQDNSEQTY